MTSSKLRSRPPGEVGGLEEFISGAATETRHETPPLVTKPERWAGERYPWQAPAVLYPEELKALRRLHKIAPLDSPYVFTTETGGPLSLQGVWTIVKRACAESGLAFPGHTHMLRHSTGHKLRAQGRHIRDIQEFLGHRNIQNTVRYTKGGGERFRGFGR